jgi:hypothetical protein
VPIDLKELRDMQEQKERAEYRREPFLVKTFELAITNTVEAILANIVSIRTELLLIKHHSLLEKRAITLLLERFIRI